VRLFAAVYPSAEAIEHLSAMVGGLELAHPRVPGQSVRLVPPERWHVTLAFLGDVPESSAGIGKAVGALEAAATRASPARIRIAGGGRFGRGRFTVVWVGLRGDLEALGTLAATTRKELRRARVPFDRQAFKPHLTLARPGDRLPADELASDLARLDSYEGPLWTIDRICLMRSFLGPKPRYEAVATAPLSLNR
jgi:RNA 2',3'-cyclic 3'-phosphodiesterase